MLSVEKFFAKHQRQKLDHFFVQEEYQAEKKIAIFRVILYALIVLEIIGVRVFFQERISGMLILALSLIFVFSVLMMVDLLFIEKLQWAKGFMPYAKYWVTVVDVFIISVMSYVVTQMFGTDQIQEWVFSLVFFGGSSLLLGVSLFRHHWVTTVVTAVLEILSFVGMKIFIFHYPGIIEIFNRNHEYQLQNALVIWIILSLAVLFSLMAGRVRAMVGRNKLQDELNRFLPENVANQVGNGEVNIKLGGEKKLVTVLFSDIRNFTGFSEKRTPEEVVDFLNSYFNDMIESVFHHHGTLDKMMGDGLMAFFGVPAEPENQQNNAVSCALDMLKRLRAFNELRKFQGKETIQIGIGIHTGDTIIGNVGCDRRMEYTAIGDTVNAASRIEDLTKKYKVPILISSETQKGLKGNFQSERMGTEFVKGKSEEVEIYKVV